jgi:hypothetical protein
MLTGDARLTSPVWLTCFVCGVETSRDPSHKLCADCSERLWENTACWIDPTWDRSVMHSAEELWVVLRRLYGPPDVKDCH